jgi:hypothetical protein
VVEGSGAGAEGLLDRVQAVQNIHAFSVIGEGAGAEAERGRRGRLFRLDGASTVTA